MENLGEIVPFEVQGRHYLLDVKKKAIGLWQTVSEAQLTCDWLDPPTLEISNGTVQEPKQ